MEITFKKLSLVFCLILLLIIILNSSGVGDKLTFSSIQGSAQSLKNELQANYMPGVVIFIGVYIFVNLWFPAGAILNLLSGYLFGTFMGAVYVDIAATTGALLSFVISRKLAGSWVQNKWKQQLIGFNHEFAKNGDLYLIMVRLIPMMPYLLVNVLAGLTKVKTTTFIWTTALGSLPGIIVFCYAGRQLLKLRSVAGVLNPKVILAFGLLAGFVALSVILRKIFIKKNTLPHLS